MSTLEDIQKILNLNNITEEWKLRKLIHFIEAKNPAFKGDLREFNIPELKRVNLRITIVHR